VGRYKYEVSRYPCSSHQNDGLINLLNTTESGLWVCSQTTAYAINRVPRPLDALTPIRRPATDDPMSSTDEMLPAESSMKAMMWT
jgi:hypothetical protein